MIGISKITKKRNLPSHLKVENIEEVLGGNKNSFKNRKTEPQNILEYNDKNEVLSNSSSTKKVKKDTTTDIIQLSVSQRAVLLSIMEKKSVFFTGSAGTIYHSPITLTSLQN